MELQEKLDEMVKQENILTAKVSRANLSASLLACEGVFIEKRYLKILGLQVFTVSLQNPANQLSLPQDDLRFVVVFVQDTGIWCKLTYMCKIISKNF